MRPLAPRTRLARFFLERLEDRLVFAVDILIDAAANRHLIDPLIYGSAFASASALADLNLPVNRSGGNSTTRYNWQQNASNHAGDWYFESISDGSATAGALLDAFVSDARNAGVSPSLTVPTLGWVAKLGAGRAKTSSFSVAKYGPQQSTDYWMPDAGNGVRTNGTLITGNDPNDANAPSDVAFQRAWIQHIVQQFGSASSGGPRFFAMDNEPSLWHETHRDVHPTGATLEEVRDKILSYAAMVKSADPGALVMGPEEWGWGGYLYSGYDQQYGAAHGWSSFPDRAAHGNMDYIPWLLSQLKANDTATGQRLLDYLTVHYYPQSGEFSDTVSSAMQLLRNRSTRSLWDPNYVDESWIGDKVRLIPRLKEWINTYYPGTKAGITEYNWGAEGHMNGATTQADILGIFGRESLDLANRWTTPAAGSPAYLAMKMYRNYDGQKGTFGETSVKTTVPNPDQVSAFSAVRNADGSLTVMVINKNLYDATNPGATTSITLNLGNIQLAGTGQVWRLAATNAADQTQTSILRLSDVMFSGSSLTFTVPMQSVTLFVLKAGQATRPAAPANPAATASAGQVNLTWTASASAASYNVYRATTSGGQGATPYRTGVTATSFTDTSVTAGTKYYYKLTAVNSAGESNYSVEVSATPPVTVQPGVSINPGGAASGTYVADKWFSGGATASFTNTVTTSGVTSPAPQLVYRSYRYGNFTYTVANLTPGATYLTRMHFAEPQVVAANRRTFDVFVNNGRVLRNFDVFAASGGRFRAVVREALAVADANGKLTIRFAAVGGAAILNGLEVQARSVLAVAAGGSGAGLYGADAYFSGGTAATSASAIDTSAVSDAAPASVYQGERYGTFTYTLTGLVVGRSYTVRLDFAEIYWSAAGQRVFNVKINGATALSQFDVFVAAGGKNKAVRREFTAVADSQGRITLSFESVVNYAKVSGIAVY